jgi:metal-responsive CopG/Arc/MetJ family transcriptional regulator
MNYKIISISLDEGAHAALRRKLKETGMTRSEYVRGLLRSDLAAHPVSRVRRPTKPKPRKA